MTPHERRGRGLFLILLTLVALLKVTGVVVTLSQGLSGVNWFRSVAQPLFLVLGFAILWQGDVWLRWLVGVAFVVSGGFIAAISLRVLVNLAGITPPESTQLFLDVVGYPVGLVGGLGLFYAVVGLTLLLSPSLRAFFRYQREGPRVWFEAV